MIKKLYIALLAIFTLSSCSTISVESGAVAVAHVDIGACKKAEKILEIKEASLFFVGDVYLGGRTDAFAEESGLDYFFTGMKKHFLQSDLVVANLESPLTTHDEPFMEKKYILKAHRDNAASLKHAGITMVSLANNHMMDYGLKGLEDTIFNLQCEGVTFSGAGLSLDESRKPALQVVNGIKVAMVSYSKTYPLEFYANSKRGGTAPGYPLYIKKDMNDAAKNNDVVIAIFHWGGERIFSPRDYQKELAHLAIDNGASIVIGHHPHVMQGVERYKDGIIFYSLGNYVFGSLSKRVEGMAVSIDVKKIGQSVKISAAKVTPLNVDNFEVKYNPTPLYGLDAARAVNSLNERSIELPGGGADMVLNADFTATVLP